MSSTEEGAHVPRKKRFKQLAKPKHAEEHSLSECAKFQPWKVDLKIEVGPWEPEPIDYTIFLRARDPDDAQYTTYFSFMQWEHAMVGIPDEDYPKVSTEVHSEATKLTEDQYMEFWKEAQTYPHRSYGSKDNPTIFRFITPDGYRAGSGLITPGAPSIIVPDKSGIILPSCYN